MDFVLATFNPKIQDDDTSSEASHSQDSSRKSAVSSAQRPAGGRGNGRRPQTDEEGFPSSPSPAHPPPRQQPPQSTRQVKPPPSTSRAPPAEQDDMDVDNYAARGQADHHHDPPHEQHESTERESMEEDSIPLRHPVRAFQGGNALPGVSSQDQHQHQHQLRQQYGEDGNEGHNFGEGSTRRRNYLPSSQAGDQEMGEAQNSQSQKQQQQYEPIYRQQQQQQRPASASGSSRTAAHEKKILEGGIASPRSAITGIILRQSAPPGPVYQVQMSRPTPSEVPRPPLADPQRRATPPQHLSSYSSHPPQSHTSYTGYPQQPQPQDVRRGSGSERGPSPSHLQFPFQSPDDNTSRRSNPLPLAQPQYQQQPQLGRIPLVGSPSTVGSRRTPPQFVGLGAGSDHSFPRPSPRSSIHDRDDRSTSDRIIPTAHTEDDEEDEDDAFVEGTPPPFKSKVKEHLFNLIFGFESQPPPPPLTLILSPLFP